EPDPRLRGPRRGGAALRGHARDPRADPAVRRRPVHGPRRPRGPASRDAPFRAGGEVVRRGAVRGGTARRDPPEGTPGQREVWRLQARGGAGADRGRLRRGGGGVLEGVSFEVRKGEIVALVGPSGVGKSTLADLILRLYDPVSGAITIDDRDLRTLRQEPYRRLFGVVPQEALLFNATIRENIAYGRENLTDADIMRAAQIANAHDFIGEFPDGYETIAGDRGVRLSGGQRQRVALARAIAGRPPILLLDEATSSLDSESDRLVQQAIDRVIQGATSIVIAHRLSTILHADRIVVLNRGRVDAVGRHAELLSTSATYS